MIQLFKILVTSELPIFVFILKINSCLAQFNIFCSFVSDSSSLPYISGYDLNIFLKEQWAGILYRFPLSSLSIFRDYRGHVFQIFHFTKEADLESLHDFYHSALVA